MALILTDQFPQPDATGVYINDVVWAQFSEPLATGTVTYYNFTVNERNTYEPVEGTIRFQGISGGIDDAIAIFVPTNGFVRNTDYTAFLSTGNASRVGNTLDHDYSWHFTTGNEAASGTIGDDQFDLDPSGFTDPIPDSSGIIVASGTTALPLEVLYTNPPNLGTNMPVNIPYVHIKFSAPIPTGVIDMYSHIDISSRGIRS